MKDAILTGLITLGIIAILGVNTYLPFPGIYAFTLEQSMLRFQYPPDLTPDAFRLKITIAALVVTIVIIAIQFLLRKACKALDLKLFHHLLTWGLFYTSAMTVLMIAGMWLDFQPWATVPEKHLSFTRVGFIFYFAQPSGIM